MADEGRRHLRAPLEPGLHQVDASARRVHLLAPQHVGRTRRQTEAAVDARVDERPRRLIGPLNADVGAGLGSVGSALIPVPARVQNSVRIERMLDGRAKRSRHRRAVPRHRSAASARASARSTTTWRNDVAARPQPLDDVPLHADIAIEREAARPERGAPRSSSHAAAVPSQLARRTRARRRATRQPCSLDDHPGAPRGRRVRAPEVRFRLRRQRPRTVAPPISARAFCDVRVERARRRFELQQQPVATFRDRRCTESRIAAGFELAARDRAERPRPAHRRARRSRSACSTPPAAASA